MDAVNATLLVVDDEPFNLEIIEEYLDGEGYSLDTAEDGEQAWRMLEENSSRYDVVLLDRMMPKMDGMEVLSRIKTHHKLKSLPVILQTAKASQDNIIEGIQAGAFYYLTKPFDDEMLRSIVRTAIEDKLRYEELTREIEQSARGLASLQQATFRFSSIDEANDLSKVLANVCPNPERAVTGISEMLINAVEHGNLGIQYDDKTSLVQQGEWRKEVDRRLMLPENKDKRVTVNVSRDSNQVRILIEDEGPGFDWASYIEFDPKRAFDTHGRGIAMAKMMSFDELNYLDNGSKVEMIIKFFK